MNVDCLLKFCLLYFWYPVVQIHTSKNPFIRDLRAVTFEVDGKDYHFDFEESIREVYEYRKVPVWMVKSQPKSFKNYTYLRVLNVGLHFF